MASKGWRSACISGWVLGTRRASPRSFAQKVVPLPKPNSRPAAQTSSSVANGAFRPRTFGLTIGGSAGACSVVGLATTTESDYKEELTAAEDPTLASTNLAERSSIATGLVQWGGEYVPLFTRLRDPQNRSRYTSANAPLSTYHGSTDGVISIAEEDGLIAGCECRQPPTSACGSRAATGGIQFRSDL